MAAWLVAAVACAAVARAAEAPSRPTLRAIGHSCFLLTTPAGARVVIDPFTSEEWPGMRLPALEADLVLVTHPHWDHDASAAVKGSPRVIAGPGVHTYKDVRVRGIAGRHAVTGGEAIRFANTVYVIEAAGVSLCHPGDNGPLAGTPGLAEAIGRPDVLLLAIDAERRVLDYEAAAAWIESLAPRVVIPMHYRVPGVTFEQVTGLGTVDAWLSGQPGFVRLGEDTMALGPDPARPEIWPAPGARAVRVLTLPGERVIAAGPARAGRAEAMEAKRRAEIAVAGGDAATALEQFQKAAEIDPSDAETLQKIGFLHMAARRPDLAADFLARAARAAGMSDTRTAATSWLGAGMALDLLGRRQEAQAAYRAVIDLGMNEENQVDQARTYLAHPYQED
jgi:L-ascorbate metabolism protein UlaG (beta-lactamase superfamily)/Flp pilus assembly protein TadD